MAHMISRMAELINQYKMLLLPFGILFSLAICFCGYKYMKAWIAAVGFMIGLGFGVLVCSRIVSSPFYIPLLVGTLLGIVLAMISYFIAKAGIFGLVALLTGEMVWNIPAMDRLTEKVAGLNLPGQLSADMARVLPLVLAFFAAVIVGMVALRLTRPVVILSTGITGAFRAVAYLMLLLKIEATEETRLIWIGMMVLLSLFGIVVQFFTTKK